MKTTKPEGKEKKATTNQKSHKKCGDQKCPHHGNVKMHGRTFKGTVLRDVFHKTVTIEFPRQIYISKYERFEKRRTRLRIHVPPCIPLNKGSVVLVKETRPISKTKCFVAVEVLK